MPCLCYLLSEGDLCAGNCCSNTSVPCDECLTKFLRRVQGTAAISGVHFLRSSALASGALPGAPSSAPFLRPHSLKAWLACHHAWSWSVLPFELGQEHWDVDFCMQGAGMDLSLSLIDS